MAKVNWIIFLALAFLLGVALLTVAFGWVYGPFFLVSVLIAGYANGLAWLGSLWVTDHE
jgi:hypothetical protein